MKITSTTSGIDYQMLTMGTSVKLIADATATATIIGAWLGVLSTTLTIIATVGAIIWWGIRLYETKTVQDYLQKRKE